jgi:hypothetical protein
MTTDQEERLSQALHTASAPAALRIDPSAVLTTARRARRRRHVATAVISTAGVATVAAVGVWGSAVLSGSTGVEPAGQSPPPASEELEIEPNPDSVLQRAGEAAQERQQDCLESRGVPVERSADGSADIGPVEGDDSQLSMTLQEIQLCGARVGFLELHRLSTEQISRLYDENLQTAQCLLEHGHEPAPTVSREDYIRTYDAAQTEANAAPWTPYSTVDDPAALQQCPVPTLRN